MHRLAFLRLGVVLVAVALAAGCDSGSSSADKESSDASLAPAAKVTVKNGAFVVEDYASELVKLTDIKKAK